MQHATAPAFLRVVDPPALQLGLSTMNLVRGAVALLAVLAWPVAHADIYKCTSETGATVYQNFTCDLDSSGATGQKTTTQRAAAKDTAKATLQPVTASTKTAAVRAARASDEPRLGMSPDEIKAIWGEPSNIYQDELVDGRVEVWSYAGGRSVQFSPLRRAVAIERQGGNGR